MQFFSVNADGSLTITLPAQLLATKIPSGTLAQITAAPGPGDVYIALDQPVGQQLYVAASGGQWTQMLNLGGSGALQLVDGSLDINLATMPMLEKENHFTGLNHFADVEFTGAVSGLPVAAAKLWVGAESETPLLVAAKLQTTLAFEVNAPGSTPGVHTSPSEFTIPSAGVYRGYAEIRSLPAGGAVYLLIECNGAEIASNGWAGGPQGGPSLQAVFSRPFAKGDILTVAVSTWTAFQVESAVFVLEN